MENGKYGSLGWCYTSQDKEAWGACDEGCPLFGQAKILGKKIDDLTNALDDIKLDNLTSVLDHIKLAHGEEQPGKTKPIGVKTIVKDLEGDVVDDSPPTAF